MMGEAFSYSVPVGAEMALLHKYPVRDSSYESNTVAGQHEQTRIPDIQNPELASLQ